MNKRLKEAHEGKRTVFFVDAAHFIFGYFLGYLWSQVRLFVKTSPGRQRYNVLGALNVCTQKLVTITNTSYINSHSVCELMSKIRRQSKKKPVTLILDNARYQHCNAVIKKAKTLKIELLFLPPYSPNLNLIERFWKLMKKKCLYCKYYKTFSDFEMALNDFLDHVHIKHKQELNSLLTWNFQDFSKVNVMPE